MSIHLKLMCFQRMHKMHNALTKLCEPSLFLRPSKRSLVDFLPEDDASRDSGIGSQPITFAKRYRSQDSQSSQVLYLLLWLSLSSFICRTLYLPSPRAPRCRWRNCTRTSRQTRRECPCYQSRQSRKQWWWRRWRRDSTSTCWARSWKRRRRRWKVQGAWVLASALFSHCLSSTHPSLPRPLHPSFPLHFLIGLLCCAGPCP